MTPGIPQGACGDLGGEEHRAPRTPPVSWLVGCVLRCLSHEKGGADGPSIRSPTNRTA